MGGKCIEISSFFFTCLPVYLFVNRHSRPESPLYKPLIVSSKTRGKEPCSEVTVLRVFICYLYVMLYVVMCTLQKMTKTQTSNQVLYKRLYTALLQINLRTEVTRGTKNVEHEGFCSLFFITVCEYTVLVLFVWQSEHVCSGVVKRARNKLSVTLITWSEHGPTTLSHRFDNNTLNGK